MGEKILITSALPYANGPLHIGHMVEYIQTDAYARALKMAGKEVLYLCADDTHGTPIEVNAAKQNKTPEQFIKEWFKKHKTELESYFIELDSFYTTHSKESKYFTELIFNRLKEKNLIYTKDIELMYCEHDKRFLPDRFVKGTCPKCKVKDQYGDICESCGTTYNPVDLIDGYCVLCNNKPAKKKSNHYFFRLSKFSKKLDNYIKNNKKLQPEIKNQILNWIKSGLNDWNISRDSPYFGFNIPGEKDKYFYVWLDAPVGYISSLANYLKGDLAKAEKHWNESKITHVIGKDIIYFHLLFWPAVLMGSGFQTPDNVVVHGFLNVNKEKMSKSRGTFFTAEDFRKIAEPEFLRYYLTANLTHSMTDIDLDVENFKARINNELVANIANFVYRTLSFTNKNFGSKLSEIKDKKLIEAIIKKSKEVIEAYTSFDYRKAVSLILEISSMGNKYFQDNEPWELIKTDKEKTHRVLTDCVNIVKILIILVKPILPKFSEEIEKQLKVKEQNFSDLDKKLENHKIGEAKIILKKIEELKLDLPEKKIAEEPFAKLNLKVAKIVKVSNHSKADKLLVVNIDMGSEKRQIVAGLKPYYENPQVLVGKYIVVVSNLEHANLRGEASEGMMLAAETKDGKIVRVVEAPKSKPGDQVYIDGISIGKETINFDEFMKNKIYVENNKVLSNGNQLQTAKEKLKSEIKEGKVR
ncbi:MAG: methionine--tRNA ligase [Nanoarchaeota archaeon]